MHLLMMLVDCNCCLLCCIIAVTNDVWMQQCFDASQLPMHKQVQCFVHVVDCIIVAMIGVLACVLTVLTALPKQTSNAVAALAAVHQQHQLTYSISD